MRHKIEHKRIFLNAFRTAVIFMTGFIIYELLLELEKLWNYEFPDHKIYNFGKRKMYKFLFVFLIDLLLLYAIIFYFKIHL